MSHRRALAAITLACALAAAAALASPAGAAEPSGPPVRDLGAGESASGATCRDFMFPVKLTANEAPDNGLYAQFCAPQGATPTEDTPLQLLIPGGSQNHTYWDSPYKPDTYSYVKRSTQAGYATLNIDPIGVGRSSKPNPLTLDVTQSAYTVHQVIQAVRGGALGPKFDTVVANSHSLGGLIAEAEASTYRDIDGLIVSGFGHNWTTSQGPTTVATGFWAAETDPKFGLSNGLQPGYLTTIPGRRMSVIGDPGSYEPAMAQQEETLDKRPGLHWPTEGHRPTCQRPGHDT